MEDCLAAIASHRASATGAHGSHKKEQALRRDAGLGDGAWLVLAETLY